MGNSCFSGLNRVASVSKRSKSSCRSSSSNHRESGAYPNNSPGIPGNKLTCSRTSKSQGNKMRFPGDSFSTPQEELMDLRQNSSSNHLRRSNTIPPLISQTNVTLSPLGVEGESGERQEPMLSIPPGPHAVLQRGNGILREQGKKEESRNLATRIEDSQLATDGIGNSTTQMQSGTNRPLKLTDSNGFVNQSGTPTLVANQGTPFVQTESIGLIQRSQSNFISMTSNSLYIQVLSQAYNGPPSHLHNGGLDNASMGSGGQRGLKIRAWIDDILRATKPGPSGLHGTAAQPRPKEADSQRVVASTKIPVSGVWDAEVERNKGDNYNATKKYSNQYSPPREEWTLDRHDSDAEITSPTTKLTESALRELDKTTTQPLSAHDVYGRIAMWMLNIVPCTLPTEVSVTDAAPLFQPPSNLGVGVQRPSTQVAPVTLPSAPATHQMQLQNSAYDDLKSKEVSNEKPMNVFSENSEPNFQEVLHT